MSYPLDEPLWSSLSLTGCHPPSPYEETEAENQSRSLAALALCTTEIPNLTPGAATAPHHQAWRSRAESQTVGVGQATPSTLPPWKVLRTPWKYSVVLAGSPALGPPTSPISQEDQVHKTKKNQGPWGSLPPSLGGPAHLPLTQGVQTYTKSWAVEVAFSIFPAMPSLIFPLQGGCTVTEKSKQLNTVRRNQVWTLNFAYVQQ